MGRLSPDRNVVVSRVGRLGTARQRGGVLFRHQHGAFLQNPRGENIKIHNGISMTQGIVHQGRGSTIISTRLVMEPRIAIPPASTAFKLN